MPDPIIFHHIQKTGGTSIRQVMQDVFGKGNVMGPPFRDKSTGEWIRPFSPKFLLAKAWYGHMSFGLHTVFDQPVPYFTIVRDPVAREVSRCCQSDLRSQLLEDIRPAWSMVFQFSGIPRNQLSELSLRHVGQALHNLRHHYLFIGDTSRMLEVGIWLKDQQNWPITLPLPHLNTATGGILVREEEQVALRQALTLDYKLYNEICRRGPYPSRW